MKTKEAIERVRSRFDKWALDNEDLTALQALGLVDVESEDEKIRKALIDEIKVWDEHYKLFKHVSKEKVLAYLEKQKEQKRSLSFDAISSWLRDHASRYVNSEFNEFHHCVEYDGTINVERLIADLKVAVDNGTFDAHEQKEQTPIFRVGDTIIAKDGTGISQVAFRIERIEDGFYWEKENSILISNQDEFELVKQKPTEKLSKEEYVKRFKSLCDAYEIKLPNREYDIYGLCDDLAKLFAGSDAKLEGSDIEELEWLIEEYRTARPDCLGSSFYKFIASEFNRRHFKLQPEQVWSKEDEQNLNICLSYIKDETLRQWLKDAIHIRYNKVEWNEEDEELAEELIKLAEYYTETEDKTEFKPHISWLKSLPERFNLQSKQEWSEEDEKFIKSLCNHFAAIAKDNYVGCYYVPDLINKIKSLRPQPHWKPSEEQIRAVFDASERNDKLGFILSTLYQDLKKL